MMIMMIINNNNNNNNNNKQTLSSLTDFSIPIRSSSFILSPHSIITNLHISLFLSRSFLSLAALLLYMLSPTVGKSKFSYALSEMSYFYYLAKLRTFGVPNWILQGARQSFLKVIKRGRTGSLLLPDLSCGEEGWRNKAPLFLTLAQWHAVI